eukprot:TRINITY_DN434_c0_g1_i1.p2 TRINITY_DN434_c0_g1~~TRINITY_DN434_c0_g1_i1.p2  ORF type:complete len:103 (-),score=18.61 TRINITY_DN434_c0_g1_i1:17-325(-)
MPFCIGGLAAPTGDGARPCGCGFGVGRMHPQHASHPPIPPNVPQQKHTIAIVEHPSTSFHHIPGQQNFMQHPGSDAGITWTCWYCDIVRFACVCVWLGEGRN